jgi:hypothetical protein
MMVALLRYNIASLGDQCSGKVMLFLLFVVNNKDQCNVYLEIHSIDARQNSNLHQPLPN